MNWAEVCADPFLQDLPYKKELYFAAGAVEFWLCDEQGELTFHDSTGLIEQSRLVPAFPRRIALD